MAHPIDVRSAADFTSLASHRYQSGARLKRALDLTGAVVGLLILSPLFLMIMLLVKLYDGGSIFYGHKRIGRNGSEFACLKFRTMVPNGDAVLKKHLEENQDALKEWCETRKLQNDPRITPFGAILRKYSLDELPQLLNILLGEMSLVGPRPVVRDELALYGPHVSAYLVSRPGLTGLWQISGRSNVSFDGRVAFDRQYVEKWTFRNDVVIILKTIPAVCASRGAY